MKDKASKLTRALYTALASGQPRHTVSSLNTGPEIPGYNPKGKSNLYKRRRATEEARAKVDECSKATLAADPRTNEEIVRDEARKSLQKYR
jgi:hypothetical protein